MTSISTRHPISASTALFKNAYFIQFMRVLWWIVAITGVYLFLYLIPINFDIFTRMPATVGSDAAADALLSDTYLEGLSVLNIAPSVYAGFKILISFIILLVFYGTSYLIFRSRFDERIGMLTSFCFMAMGAFVSFVTNYAPEANTFDSMLYHGLGFTLAIIAWGSFYVFLILYPDGRFKPIWSIIAPLVWGLSILGDIFPNTILGFFSTEVRDGIGAFGLGLIMFGVPLLAQIYRYFRVFTPLQRQQVKWFLYVLAWLVLASIIGQFLQIIDTSQAVNVVLIDFINVINVLTFALLPLAVGNAILRYRLWDIDLVINKSLVYGIFLGLSLLLFAALLAGIQIVIGQSQPIPALVIALVLSAVIFRPAQRQIQRFVDRRIYRLNFDLNELEAAHKKREITHPGLLTGQIVDGYQVADVIGKGGMGEIYTAFKDNKVVAVKTLLPDLAQDNEFLLRFQREVNTGERLKHRNIATVYSSGVLDGTPYLIMEYINGQDLRSLLKRDGIFDEETTRQIIKNVCDALDAAHAQGFVHRDIKPANIMLRDNGEAVLMDFGVTKVKEGRTLTGSGAIGTIDYMAPEQIMSSRTVDHRADIYALGVLMFELLTGEKPFKGTAAQVMFAHLQQPAPTVRDIKDDVPERFSQAIDKALAKNPDDRFNSAFAFAEAL